ncbi:MAG: LLM class oxidoreductase [Bacteroidota bacterium]
MRNFSEVATKGKLTLGLVFPIASYPGAIAPMENQELLAQRAEAFGFKALWFRDVPFLDPAFGDAGQLYDPWVYMTHIMHHTKTIALATGSILLPLRHPIHTAKALNSLQLLSKGRVFLGIASGDRPKEYPAFNKRLDQKGALFRDSFGYLKALQHTFPIHTTSNFGELTGDLDLVPKYSESTPLLVTGHSGQKLDWIAAHSDGWLYYPRNFNFLERILQDWQSSLKRTGQTWKPYMQSLYIDLLANRTAQPKSIHLGFQSGVDFLLSYLRNLEHLGVNHVILNLKYGSRPVEQVIEELGEFVVPYFG